MAINRGALAPARALDAGAIVLAIVLAGCAAEPPATATTGIRPSYNKDTGRLERITYDRNNDGRIDATAFMNATRIVRAELDENFDGVPDRWEYYADEPASARSGPSTGSGPSRAASRDGGTGALKGVGLLERVEQATGSSGRVTRWETYDHGSLRSAEEDADGDGRVDKWETWSDGALVSIALDTAGRGRPDRRMLYPASGGDPRLELADDAGRFPSDSPTR